MKAFAKTLLVTLAVLLAVFGAALISINLYLQSQSVQNRIRFATEEALRVPVIIRRTSYTPWHGLTLSGLSVPEPDRPRHMLFEAAHLALQVELLPLLQRRVVIHHIELAHPKLNFRERKDGQWVAFLPVPPPKTLLEQQKRTQRERTKKTKRSHGPAYQVELRQVRIRGGELTCTDRKGRSVLAVHDLDTRLSIASTGTVQGDIHIGEVALRDRLIPRKVRAHFLYQPQGRIQLSDIKAALANGRLRAGMDLELLPTPQLQLEMTLDSVQIPLLLQELTGHTARQAAGTLEGHCTLLGNPQQPNTLEGTGHLQLHNAQLVPFELIQMLGDLFQIEEFQRLTLRKALVHFEISDGQVTVEELAFESDNMLLQGTGPIAFNGQLALEGKLLINQNLQSRFRGMLSRHFEPAEDPAFKQLAFEVTGTLERPKTNLVEKLVGFKVNPNLAGMLQSLLLSDALMKNMAPPPANPSTSKKNSTTPQQPTPQITANSNNATPAIQPTHPASPIPQENSHHHPELSPQNSPSPTPPPHTLPPIHPTPPTAEHQARRANLHARERVHEHDLNTLGLPAPSAAPDTFLYTR